MRYRFEQQPELGTLPIEETPVMENSRDDVPRLIAALLFIYRDKELSDKILSILEDKITKGKQKTGRKGLGIWQVFVLATFRLGLGLDYDRLHYMVGSDSNLRQLLGIKSDFGTKKIEIGYQQILDNVHLIDEPVMSKINDVIVLAGHRAFKKKVAEGLDSKTDSFVVKANVHFPTDYNLLWDASRKSLDTVMKFKGKYDIDGWRKSGDWHKTIKRFARRLGQASSSGGKGKQERVKKAAREYIAKASALLCKLKLSMEGLPVIDEMDLANIIRLEYYMEMMYKHIDLVDRRVLKGEKIPHGEKLFSIFEPFTEWINKGKSNPNVELGKMVSVTTDQFGLIIDYLVMDHQADSQVVVDIAYRVLKKYKIRRWSFDKGFWHKINQELLRPEVGLLVMPKKGKPNKEEHAREHTKEFKKGRDMHSAVESNINELGHSGLGRCPDKGFHGFKRYIGMGVVAYNLKRIGKELIRQEHEKKTADKGSPLKMVA